MRSEPRVFDTPTPGPLGSELKDMFDHICEGPMPKSLVDLVEALEDAFQKGKLSPPTRPSPDCV